MKKSHAWIAVTIGAIVLIGLVRSFSPHPGAPTSPQVVSFNTTGNSPTPVATPTPASTPVPTPTPTPACFSAAQAAGAEGQYGCVQFTGYAYTSSKGQMYLDQYTSAPYGFSAWIPAGLSFGPSLLEEYSGRTVKVMGTITNYDGEPEIVVESHSQVQ